MKSFFRIALLVTLILSTVFTVSCMKKHEHTFEEWINYAGNDSVYCENRLFYRICTECSVLEWKNGSYDDHIFGTVNYAPTCTSKGYDEKTCTICGFVERVNETDIIPHPWSSEYSFDNSFHWVECNTCDAINAKAEHTLGEDGTCTVCDATLGIVYDLFADGTYYEVVGYTGTAKRVRIVEECNGLPVKSIYNEAFKNLDNITSVIIPDSVTSIGKSAFSGCSSLTSVTIPDSVRDIGSSAFKDCSSLTSVTIPDSVTSIGSSAFSRCNSALYTEYNYGKYVGDSENPYAVLTEVTNKNLSTYEINPATEVIAGSVFYGCSRLSSITIPDSVRGIGGHAFYYCSSLTSVTIPDSVTSIGGHAFKSCTNLTSVTIPVSVTSIGDGAFNYCSSLTSIKYRGTEAEWREISLGENWSLYTGSYTITYNYED